MVSRNYSRRTKEPKLYLGRQAWVLAYDSLLSVIGPSVSLSQTACPWDQGRPRGARYCWLWVFLAPPGWWTLAPGDA